MIWTFLRSFGARRRRRNASFLGQLQKGTANCCALFFRRDFSGKILYLVGEFAHFYLE